MKFNRVVIKEVFERINMYKLNGKIDVCPFKIDEMGKIIQVSEWR